MKKRSIVALGACIGDFEQWIIDEQRREKKRKKKKPKPKEQRAGAKA